MLRASYACPITTHFFTGLSLARYVFSYHNIYLNIRCLIFPVPSAADKMNLTHPCHRPNLNPGNNREKPRAKILIKTRLQRQAEYTLLKASQLLFSDNYYTHRGIEPGLIAFEDDADPSDIRIVQDAAGVLSGITRDVEEAMQFRGFPPLTVGMKVKRSDLDNIERATESIKKARSKMKALGVFHGKMVRLTQHMEYCYRKQAELRAEAERDAENEAAAQYADSGSIDY